MNRDLSFERVYKITDFNTVRLGDTITGIPEHLALNSEVVAAIRMLQIIQTEKAYFNYRKKKDIIHEHSIDDALALLEEAGKSSVRKLRDVINEVENGDEEVENENVEETEGE